MRDQVSRAWDEAVRAVSRTRSGMVDRTDFLFVRTPPSSPALVALLVDAGGRAGWASIARRTVFQALAPAWTAAVAGAAALLERLGEDLHRWNLSHDVRLFASAAAIRVAASGDVELAEAGDTTVWRVGATTCEAVWREGVPRPDRPAEGQLGTKRPLMRTTVSTLSAGERLVMLTGGAVRALHAAGLVDRATLARDPVAALRDPALAVPGDATAVSVTVPAGAPWS